MTKEALKLALEAVEEAVDCAKNGYISNYLDDWENAITAIKEALAQPEQEPVAWVCMKGEEHDIDFDQSEIDAIPVGTFLYTTPPKRPWSGLTDEEIQSEWVLTPQNDKAEGIWFGRRIEAKLKEKNT